MLKNNHPQHLLIILIKMLRDLVDTLAVPTMIALTISGIISLPFIYSNVHTEVDGLFSSMTAEIEAVHPELVHE